MEHLFAGWRAQFVTGGERASGCVFCTIGAESGEDDRHYVVARGEASFVVLNLYPYTSGHLMVVPRAHIGDLAGLSGPLVEEMLGLVRSAHDALQAAYQPEGVNIGMNLGRAAGAGIVEHVHIHLVPRWSGDANFMSTLAETRVLPETLSDTMAKLRAHWPPG
ncbi:MAG: HIT family protein [Ferrimicrobium sp.]|uniref:HIT domain-containing protein n=1 Tax=Ferrimicrobium acidiphilum TaxID=121039 RepID=A0ABV3Y0R0_9ACTN|nr:HIT domain-containing protein [Ferrimicrobium sp.]MCL5974024.1 HIT domain-containing protein [Actinomycetota bacterium]